LPVALAWRAEFEDVFDVRDICREPRGRRLPPHWRDAVLSFEYEGADGLFRGLSVHCAPAPQECDGPSARYRIELPPRGHREILVLLVVAESTNRADIAAREQGPPEPERIEALLGCSTEEWLGQHTEVRSDDRPLDTVMDRSLRDLRLLRTRFEDREVFAAGIPWYVALFGRDSLITAYLTLAYRPDMAEQTLRLLAAHQGERIDETRDEEPGKILHELRIGELARLGQIPQTPYYGAIDTTLWFLIVLAHHAAWTGDLALFRDLRPNGEAALEWTDRHGDRDGDGYLEYHRRAPRGLDNQGWKDSGEAIVHPDGRRAEPPIALVEVQGYAYLAKTLIAALFERDGQAERATQLRRQAETLRERFNRDFWLEDQNFYAIALDKEKRPVASIASNPGQALWTGIVDPARASQVIDRLMSEDMYSGWGVRTLSARERAFNPLGYHLGTVWPHDNALIAAGCRRYGRTEAALRILADLVEAARSFDHHRLPELVAGFGRDEFDVPARYPDACHPQAWSAASVPFLVATALGLEPEAFERRLRIVQPLLPESCDWLELRRLHVGTATADLRFTRTAHGPAAEVEILRVAGPLDVAIEPSTSRQSPVVGKSSRL
jgi:glycogen debranching enzyme